VPNLECYNPRPMNAEQGVRFAAVFIVVSLFIGYALVDFPANQEDTSRLLDYSEFYAAGQIVRQGMGSRLYDLGVQADFQLRVAPVHAFYLRPPFETLLFVPFTSLSYRSSYSAWIIFSLGLLAVACRLIESHTNVLDALSQYARGVRIDFGLLLVIFLTFAPTMDCFLIGQDSVLMLMVYTLVFVALKRNREFAAGCFLACGLFKFHLVLPFAIIFLLRRRWSFLLGFTSVALVLGATSVLLCGPGVIAAYPGLFLNSKYRVLLGFQPEYAANIRGFIYLLTNGKFPIVAGTLTAAASGLLLWLTARKWDDRQLGFCFSAAVVVALLTGYHLFVYDLILLLLPCAIVCGELARRKSLLSDTPLTLVLIVFFVPTIHRELILHHIYALMCLPMVFLFVNVMRKVEFQSPGLNQAAG
jgi:hypothetical protein